MSHTSNAPNIDRREFLNARWDTAVATKAANSSIEIASILVQARPERIDAVARAIKVLAGVQIYSRDSKGKLVVVVEASDVGVVGDALNKISTIPGVLTAALIFHATDNG
jgi:nitrate reductase NapD